MAGPGLQRAGAAFALALSLAMSISSCQKARLEAPVEAPPGYPIPAGGSLVLVVGEGGSLAPPGAGAQAAPPGRAPFASAVTAAAIQPVQGGAILAVNRTGLRRLTVERRALPDGAVDARLVVEALPGAEQEFPGRTVGQSWGRGGEALFLLYRHPIFEASPPRSPASVVIAATFGEARALEPGIGGDAYAVFPVSPAYWLAQYRSESGDRVSTGYARLSPSGDRLESLERAAFERAASPAPMALAPEPLRAAAARLSGPILVEARLPDGSRRAFARGDPGLATPAWGHVATAIDAEGDTVIAACIVTDDWRVAVARPSPDGYAATALYPQTPFPGAVARDAALAGGLVVVLWEEDLFPDVGASGLVALDPGL